MLVTLGFFALTQLEFDLNVIAAILTIIGYSLNDKVVIEFRGLGLKSDTAEQRRERVFDHNMIWGPFGRNLHEDLLAVHGQGRAMHPGSEATRRPPS